MTILIIFDNWDNWDNFDNFDKTVLETCDIWDTDYSSDNWETEFITIFGTRQLIVTLDSIRNSGASGGIFKIFYNIFEQVLMEGFFKYFIFL